jgi:hypothetical protein
MLQQVHELDRCLASPEPWSALVTTWPDLASARHSLAVTPEPLVDLLGRYRDEWHAVGLPATDRLLRA